MLYLCQPINIRKMKGILLVNLGSPDSTDVPDVKRYLDEFLMDKRVIDYNIIKRNLLIRGIILRRRPPRTSEAYQKIWQVEGSPLIIISKKVSEKLQQITDLPVALGMRYGNPSIESGMQALVNKGVTEIAIVPLYPHYAMSSTETVVAKAKQIQQAKFPNITLHITNPFYNDKGYVQAMADNIRKKLPAHFDKIVFSFHGIPERHFYRYGHGGITDLTTCSQSQDEHHNKYCYLYHAAESVRLLVGALNIPQEKVVQTFQSRLGREKWVEPYTDVALETLPKQGVENVVILCPAFVSDCLETLEEIEMEGAHSFKENGGVNYTYIPCMNDNDDWIAALKQICMDTFEKPYEVPMMIDKL